jgi:HSP20 family protein
MIEFRGDLFNQMDLIQQEMNRLLDHFAGSKPPQVRFSLPFWEPAVDVYETKDKFVVVVELAGVRESDMRLTVDGDVFTVEGVRRKSAEAGERRAYHRMEIAGGPFRRSLKLPVAVDTRKMQASCENGLVEVILPKGRGGSLRVDIKVR